MAQKKRGMDCSNFDLLSVSAIRKHSSGSVNEQNGNKYSDAIEMAQKCELECLNIKSSGHCVVVRNIIFNYEYSLWINATSSDLILKTMSLVRIGKNCTVNSTAYVVLILVWT